MLLLYFRMRKSETHSMDFLEGKALITSSIDLLLSLGKMQEYDISIFFSNFSILLIHFSSITIKNYYTYFGYPSIWKRQNTTYQKCFHIFVSTFIFTF